MAFETIFPGHYDGRAIHTHLLTKSNVTVRENSTTAGGAVTHIGQLFYPEALVTEVEATAPYNSNTQAYTSNDEDMWSIVQAENDYDPFPQFVYIGETVSDGLLAWIQIGINSTADHTDDDYYSIAATYQAGGGVANSDANTGFGGGQGGGPGGNGTAPSGLPPSGGIPSGTIPSATSSAVEEVLTSSAVVSSSVEAATSSSVVLTSSSLPRGSGVPPRPQGGQQNPGRKQQQQQQARPAQQQGNRYGY